MMGDAKAGMTRRAALLGGLAAGVAAPGWAQGQSTGKNPRPEVAFTIPPTDPRVAEIVEDVSIARVQAHVRGLAGFPTRWSASPHFGVVEDWLASAFEAVGSGQVATRQPYQLREGVQRHNIIWGNPIDPRGVILVGAHFDSISEQPSLLAPGANDNASGVAAMLETQRILSAYSFAHEIVYVGFSGEEQGLVGSTACARAAIHDRWPVRLMVNLDMLGHHPADPAVPMFVEYDQGNATAANDAAARGYGQLAAEMAAAHSTLNIAYENIVDSDYMPFEAAGFPCIGLYDGGAGSSEYHSSSDLPDRVDYERLTQATRILAATVATAAVLV